MDEGHDQKKVPRRLMALVGEQHGQKENGEEKEKWKHGSSGKRKPVGS